MKDRRTVYRWWWGWVPETIEMWLEEMDNDGWNLKKIELFGIKFIFKRGNKKKVRYCADYQECPDSYYFQYFSDDGWTLVWSGAMCWYIWRKIYTDQRPESYSNQEDLIAQNAKFIKMFISLGIIYLFLLIILMPLPFIGSDVTVRTALIVLLGFWVFIYMSLSLAAFKHNRRLTRERIRE